MIRINKTFKNYLIGASLLVVLFVLIFFLIKKVLSSEEQSSNPLTAIPKDAIVVLQVNKPLEFFTKVNLKNSHWNWLSSFNEVNNLTSFYSEITNIVLKDKNLAATFAKTPLYISLHNLKGVVCPLYLFSNQGFSDDDYRDVFASKFNLSVAETSINSQTIYSLKKGKQEVFWISKNGLSVFCENKNLIESCINQMSSSDNLLKDADFMSVSRTAGRNATCNIFLNPSALDFLSASLMSKGEKSEFFNNNWKGWTALDYEPEGNAIQLSGFSSSKNGYLSMFSGNGSSGNSLVNVLPEKTLLFVHFSFADDASFLKNYFKYYQQNNPKEYKIIEEHLKSKLNTNPERFFNFMDGEIAFQVGNSISDTLNSMLLIKVKNSDEAAVLITDLESDSLNSFEKKEVDGNPYYINKSGLYLTSFFKNLIPIPEYKVCTFIDNVLVVATTVDQLKDYRAKVENDQLLIKNKEFSIYQDQISANANITFCAKSISALAGYSNVWTSGFSKWISKNIDLMGNLGYISAQFTNQAEKFYSHFSLEINGSDTLAPFKTAFVSDTTMGIKDSIQNKNMDNASVSDENVVWNYKLNSNIRGDLNVVTMGGGAKDLLVQDESNNVYLMNMKGECLWTKKVDGVVNSDFYAVDFSKNGSYFVFFSTGKTIYAYDSKGNSAKGYPKIIKEGISSGISIFDFDNKRDYRLIFCTNDKRVHYQNIDGTDVKGWGYSKSADIVNNPVQFFRTSKKDLIVIRENNGKINLLNRKGESFAQINDPSRFSQKRSMYLSKYDGKQVFCYMKEDGAVKMWSVDGKEITFNSEYKKQNNSFMSLDANSNSEFEFLFMRSNQIIYSDAKGKVLFNAQIPSAVKNIPRYINWKGGVFSVSTMTNKTFVIDKTGKVVNGFPISSQTNVVIYDVNSDGKQDVVFALGNSLKSLSIKP